MPSVCEVPITPLPTGSPPSGVVRKLSELIDLAGPRDTRPNIAQLRQQANQLTGKNNPLGRVFGQIAADHDAYQEYLDSLNPLFRKLFDILDKLTAKDPPPPPEQLGLLRFTTRREGYAILTLNDLSGDTIKAIRFLNLMGIAIDETDLGLSGRGVVGTDSPETFTPTIVEGSRLGTVFAEGDFFIWNDVDAEGFPHYEICQIKTLAANGQWTIRRGQFCSTIESHGIPSVPCTFYRLQPYFFTPAMQQNMYQTDAGAGFTPSGLPTKWEFLHANKCVVAIFAQAIGLTAMGRPLGTNLAPTADEILVARGLDPGTFLDTNPQLFPIAPGLRTMNGAAYPLTIAGDLEEGLTADFPHRLDAWEQLRTVYGMLATPSTGETNSAAAVVYVIYINPERTLAALVDTLIWRGGHRNSYDDDPEAWDLSYNPPDGRQMPYHAQPATPRSFLSRPTLGEGYQQYPGHLFPRLDNALDADGNLQADFTLNTIDPWLQASPDGWVDLWVAQIGTDEPGSNLVVRYQT